MDQIHMKEGLGVKKAASEGQQGFQGVSPRGACGFLFIRRDGHKEMEIYFLLQDWTIKNHKVLSKANQYVVCPGLIQVSSLLGRNFY